MAKGFALKDLYDLISVNANISTKTASKVWETALDVIISELQYNDKIAINNFGRFDKVFKGGKDEWFTNELGIPEKRYVEPIMSIEFKPSVNFLKRLNEDIVEQMGKVEPSDPFFDYGNVIVDKDIELSLNDKIDLVLERKNKRRQNEIKREKKYKEQKEGLIPKEEPKNIFKGKMIKCITTGKVYPSMNKASKELNLRVNNIKKVLDTDESLYGYKFVTLTENQYEEEMDKLEEMRKNNES